MLVTCKRDSTMPTLLLINGQHPERVYSYKYLGIQLTSGQHISTLFSKAQQQIGHKFYTDMDTLKQHWYAGRCILNMQLLFTTFTCLRINKNLNLYNISHLGSVRKVGMMLTVICCVPWTYPHSLMGGKLVINTKLFMVSLISICIITVQALH